MYETQEIEYNQFLKRKILRLLTEKPMKVEDISDKMQKIENSLTQKKIMKLLELLYANSFITYEEGKFKILDLGLEKIK